MSPADSRFAGPIPKDAFKPTKSDHSLEVGIIGAGIAGLGAAVALRSSGHKVEIFERSRFKNEVGAAINVCPNAARPLHHYGFDFQRSKAVAVRRVGFRKIDSIMSTEFHLESEFMKADSLDTIMAADFHGLPEKFGANYYFMHRVDLHTELRRLAEEPDGYTEPVRISLSSEVTDVNIDSGELTLKDGSKHKKDVVVAADGIHSFLTAKVIGSDNSAHPTGQSAFRFLIPTEKLLKDPETRDLIEGRPDGIYVGSGPDRRLDNAHKSQDQGQGGAQAIEDGAALGALLSKLRSVEEVPARLRLFERVRKNRASAMQIFSNVGQDQAEKNQAKAQQYVDGPVPSKTPVT
ncbi:MAG: hypothetical protein M1822_001214 [Bathelium mastoideum]|nr:MAG: hypothetical protein M1822_001214 [Bathelium mastoideum]